eukprot:jgi/Ulvmu1/3732/UM173_0005.1
MPAFVCAVIVLVGAVFNTAPVWMCTCGLLCTSHTAHPLNLCVFSHIPCPCKSKGRSGEQMFLNVLIKTVVFGSSQTTNHGCGIQYLAGIQYCSYADIQAMFIRTG